jgi:hypothetical protein
VAEAVEALIAGALWPKGLAELGVEVEHLSPLRLG